MPRSRTSLLLQLLVPCSLLGSVLTPATAHAATGQENVHRQLARPHRTGVAAPATTGTSVIDVVVPLHLSTAARRGVERLAHERASAYQRRAQLRALAPAPWQAAQVTAWAERHGFTVTSTGPWSVGLRGRAASLASAFGTSLRTTGFHGKRFVTPQRATAVPRELAGVADPVVGLDTRPLWSGHAVYGGGDIQVLNSTPVRGRDAGAGATVATVNLSGWHPSDLTTYRQAAFGSSDVAPTVTNVVVAGGHVAATVAEDDYGMETEVALDAETIAGVAPAAKQRMYFGGNSTAGYVAILQRMAQDLTDADVSNDFTTASTSWGMCELAVDDATLVAMRTAITAITAAGATFFAASGDSGAYGCGDGLTPAVDFPASAENAVAVGGTTVTGTAPSYGSTAWSGSGGGCSSRIPAPSRQAVAGNPCSGRAVPDIATIADPSSGYWVYDHVYEWLPIGGTSLAAPASAAGLATAQAHAGLATLSTPFLTTAYLNPSDFTDVTSGDNGLYRAGTGYDLVTGLGSPRWTAVEDAINGAAPAPTPTGHNEPLLAINPTSDPSSAALDVELIDGSSTENGFAPNGEPVTGYALATDCSATSAAPPSYAPLPGAEGTVQLSLSVATSGPSGCITVQRPVVVDSVTPVASAPVATYVGTTAPAYRFSWGSATDAAPSSGILLYVVMVRDLTTSSTSSVSFTTGRAFPSAGAAPFKAVNGHRYSAEVYAVDRAWNYAFRMTPFASFNDTKATLSKHLSNGRYVSDWSRTKSGSDYLGSHVVSGRKGASFTFSFTAKTVTLGVVKSPYGGYADVYLDGVKKSRISLYSSGTRYRQPVRVVNLTTRGTHKVKVVVTGVHPSASKGNLVYLDSIAVSG